MRYLSILKADHRAGINPAFFAEFTGQKTIMVFDTETPGLAPNNLVYDFGCTIVDAMTGKPIACYAALIEEVFTNYYKMTKAYFARKIYTEYPYLLQDGIEKLVPAKALLEHLESLKMRYNIIGTAAYNARFDYAAFVQTSQLLSVDFDGYFASMDQCDLWLESALHLMGNEYKQWAIANDLVSDAGNIRTNAEVCFKFVEHCPEFCEDHTALSDSCIESAILNAILQKVDYTELRWNNFHTVPWHIVNDHATKEMIRFYRKTHAA